MATVDLLFKVFAITSAFPELFRPLFWLFSKIGEEGKGSSFMKSFTMAHIHARINDVEKQKSGSKDQMNLWVKKYNDNPEKFTIMDIYLHSSANFIAGSDTTSSGVSAVFYYLCKYPRVLQLLRKEIDDSTAAGKLSDPISYHQANKMPYFQAVVKEALRINPSGAMAMERVVPKGGATVAGTHFPEGVS
jgi:cytochrome P450